MASFDLRSYFCSRKKNIMRIEVKPEKSNQAYLSLLRCQRVPILCKFIRCAAGMVLAPILCAEISGIYIEQDLKLRKLKLSPCSKRRSVWNHPPALVFTLMLLRLTLRCYRCLPLRMPSGSSQPSTRLHCHHGLHQMVPRLNAGASVGSTLRLRRRNCARI